MKRFGNIIMAAVLLALLRAAGAWAVEPLETYTYDAVGNLTRVESWFEASVKGPLWPDIFVRLESQSSK